MPSDTYARIYSVVRRIPRGKVATYGQVAALAGLRGHARQVGYALHALSENARIPWHRVINAKGEISLRSAVGGHHEQRMRLEREGVEFDQRNRVNLDHFGWTPRLGRR